MAYPKKLRVYARGTALVSNYDAVDAGIYDRNIGRDKQLVHDENGSRIAWVPRKEPTEVPARAEYVRAMRDGDLWPADQETAAYCGVAFDPTFGGEDAAQE